MGRKRSQSVAAMAASDSSGPAGAGGAFRLIREHSGRPRLTPSRQPPRFVRQRWSLGQAGVVHLVVCGLIFWAGIKTQANLLFWGLGLLLGAMVVSVGWSWLVMRRIELQRLLPDHAVAGQALTLRYRLVSGQRWMPAFNLVIEEMPPMLPVDSAPSRRRSRRFRRRAKPQPFGGMLAHGPLGWVVHLGAKQTAQAQAVCWPGKRGRLILGPMRLSSRFPFGIVCCTMEFDQPDHVLVYPELYGMKRHVWHRLAALDPAGHWQADRSGGAEEFFGLRRYRPGDSLRSIDWRHSAKTGQLISRELTQPSPPRVMILLDLTPGVVAGEAAAHDGPSTAHRGMKGWSERWLWFRVFTGLASRNEHQLWAQLKAGPARPLFTPEQLQERAVSLTASLVCGAYLQGYQVGLRVVGAVVSDIRPHHSLPHRSRLLEALTLLEPSGIAESNGPEEMDAGRSGSGSGSASGLVERGEKRGGIGGGRGGGEPTLVVTASSDAARGLVGRAMHISADRLEEFVKPVSDHGSLLSRSVSPVARQHRLTRGRVDSPTPSPDKGESWA